jgi:hypothetical protein
LIVFGSFLTACATPPTPTTFINNRTYPIGKDEAWERLLNFFTSNNIQIKTIEKDSGVIYAERSLSDPTMSNCGGNALALEMGRPATMNVFVRSTGNQTQVTVNAEFTAIRTFDGKTWADPCYSTGVIEQQILNSIENG